MAILSMQTAGAWHHVTTTLHTWQVSGTPSLHVMTPISCEHFPVGITSSTKQQLWNHHLKLNSSHDSIVWSMQFCVLFLIHQCNVHRICTYMYFPSQYTVPWPEWRCGWSRRFAVAGCSQSSRHVGASVSLHDQRHQVNRKGQLDQTMRSW